MLLIKTLKMVGIIILIIIISWIIYVSVDCLRLKSAEAGTKPFITSKETIKENCLIYKGIGYSIQYYCNNQQEENSDLVLKQIYGAEFRIFDKILVWAWIE